MSKGLKTIIWIVVIALVIWGIYTLSNNEQISTDGPIRIGLSTPLTGQVAAWGQNVLAGVTLAAKEINDNGGINGKKIEFVVEDDKGQSTDSVNAVNKLINIDEVTAMILGSGSPATASVIPILTESKTPAVISIASAANLPDGEYVFRVMPSDSLQGKFSAKFIKENLGFDKIALVYEKNDWGEGLTGLFKENFDGEILYENGILPNSGDLKTEITKIKETDAEAIYLPAYPTNVLTFAKQAQELGLNLPIICGDAVEGEIAGNEYAEGIIYLIAKVDTPDEFKAKLNNMEGFGDLVVNIAGPMGYDAAKVLFSAIEKAGTSKEKIRKALKETSYENGISNPVIEFDENGNVKTANFEARIIMNGESVSYEK